ncbi:TIGR03086 family metal-binding protein [Kitasatospora kazusensis]|uniref:TIGR03086 family metal-binding protein n=1 Tax=Kitasatospora kazusensis TaxID=407974 RepID=A0ABP5LM52_9ACTN
MSCYHEPGAHRTVLSVYDEVVGELDRLVALVSVAGWGAPTPCADWSIRDLVNHATAQLLWVSPLVNGGTIASTGRRFDGDVLGVNPVGMWSMGRTNASGAFHTPDALDRQVRLSYGPRDGLGYCVELTTELTLHTWDLAKALGGSGRLSETIVRFAWEEFRTYQDLPATGQFAPALPVGPDSGPLTVLLARAGRDANWTPSSPRRDHGT